MNVTTFCYHLSGHNRRGAELRERRAVTRGVEPCPQRGGIPLSNRKRNREALRNNSSLLDGAVDPFREQSEEENRPFKVKRVFTSEYMSQKSSFYIVQRAEVAK